MDTFLKNCRIIDGSGAAPYSGGILIRGEKIERIMAEPPDGFMGDEIDCEGLTVTPGFIDCHSHSDWFALSPGRHRHFDPFLLQGVTTFVAGNCGFSVPGYDGSTQFKDQIGGGLFTLDEASAQTNQFEQWFRAVDGHCPANMALLVGHGTARIAINGNKDKPLSPEGKAAMLEQLELALQQGACGVSLGLMYEPGLYAPKEELIEVARLCAKYGKLLTVHSRACSAISLSYKRMTRSHLLLALDELAEIVRATGVRLQVSHLIFVGRRSWKDVGAATSILRKLKDEGYDVGFDLYPLDYGASIITVVLPDWYQAMPPHQRRKWLNKLRLAAMVRATTFLLGFNFSDIRIAWAGPGQENLTGKTITEIARERGVPELDAYLDVCEKSNFKAKVLMGSYQNEEIVRTLMRNDQSLFMTDAWVEAEGNQNGSIYGAFPRFLSIARDMGMPMEQAVAKMTGLTARRFGLENRGLICEGCYADLNVLDLDRLQDRIEQELPPKGIRYTFVNGTIVAKDGAMLTERSEVGRALPVL